MEKLKAYRLPLILVAIGVALLAAVWTVSVKWISWPVGIAAFLFILLGLQMANNIADHQAEEEYPDYKGEVAFSTTGEKILHYFGYALLLLTGLGITLLGKYFENTISGTAFFFECALAGLLFAVLFYKFFKLGYKAFFLNNEKRISAIMGYCAFVMASAIWGQAYYNIATASHVEHRTVYVAKKSKNISKGTLYVFLNMDGKEERFNPSAKDYASITQGDSVILTYGKGNLGYYYIFKFTGVK